MVGPNTKKRFLNIAMAAMAALVVFSAAMLALSLKESSSQVVSAPSSEEGLFAREDEAVGAEEDAGSVGEAANAVNGGSAAAGAVAGAAVSGSSTGSSADADDGVKTCTIQIRCDTILNNMDALAEGKESLVPSNGVILATSTVQFSAGDTVFDVLRAVCSAAGLHLEYSYTPLYESYYIEGINNLYEFDCGSESGWVYQVNGWFPNYGCSSYQLKDGDSIVWSYTCNGLGADVGGSMNR